MQSQVAVSFKNDSLFYYALVDTLHEELPRIYLVDRDIRVLFGSFVGMQYQTGLRPRDQPCATRRTRYRDPDRCSFRGGHITVHPRQSAYEGGQDGYKPLNRCQKRPAYCLSKLLLMVPPLGVLSADM